MNDERTDFEIALDDLLQVARHAPRTGEGYQEIQAARRAFLAAFPPPAPGEVTISKEQLDGLEALVRAAQRLEESFREPQCYDIQNNADAQLDVRYALAALDAAAAPGAA